MMIIVMGFCMLLSIATYVAGYFQFREKGILLNNAYLYASKEERQKMDKKPYYRQSGIVFCLIGTIFLLLAIQTITEWQWICYVVLVISVAVVVYAVVSSIQIEKNKCHGNT